jgi:hypothetical protein
MAGEGELVPFDDGVESGGGVVFPLVLVVEGLVGCARCMLMYD